MEKECVCNMISDIWDCKAINDIVYSIEGKHIQLFEQYSCAVVRKEFAKDVKLMHRGYYCPSLISDVISGNVERGKIVKEKSTKGKIDFIYGFNALNQLITIEGNSSKEFIMRDKNKEIGIMFNDFGIEGISECIYDDNKLQMYAYYDYLAHEGVLNCELERYTYLPEKLIVDLSFYSCPNNKLISNDRYVFEIKDGYLCNYSVINANKDKKYNVMIKRSIQ